MNDLKVNTVKKMSSREIARLMGKEHFNVLRDIKKLIKDGAIGAINFDVSYYKSDQNKDVTMYELDFDGTMTLITGYDAKRRAVIIKRWRELETGEAEPACKKRHDSKELPYWGIEANGVQHVLTMVGAPESLIACEMLKHVYKVGGPDMRDRVGELPCAQNVPKEDIMLEPTELGSIFGMSGTGMNQLLASIGLQNRVGKFWEPTEKGKPLCAPHQWDKKSKSGFNLKWRKEKILNLLKSAWAPTCQ